MCVTVVLVLAAHEQLCQRSERDHGMGAWVLACLCFCVRACPLLRAWRGEQMTWSLGPYIFCLVYE